MDQNSCRWERLEELFAEAIELPRESQAAFVERETASDSELGAQLRALLDHDTGARVRIAETIRRAARAAVRPTEWKGQRFGPYRIEREIGRGGMGLVFQAVRDDDEYRKTVALKIAPWWRDPGELRERFRHERQILAGLEHPNIARFLDGGTQDGIPYFAMEYVEGCPITEYAVRHGLKLREKIELFRQVCAAVHYAHQNLLVHRDLKPGNILVSAAGMPKLLDFGIAKLLSPVAEGRGNTQTGAAPWTPDYASPEQVRCKPITARSDIYSLGLILFELLTGERGQIADTSSPLTLDSSICESQTPLPSTRAPRALARQLTGDLDTIVGKALHKDPERRYSSVAEFSDDLGRYLEGRPVLARKDSLAYRAGKLLRMHRVPVIAAAAAVLAFGGAWLLGGGGRAGMEQDTLPSVAVLPFLDMSPARDQGYLCDGITEELIQAVQRIRGLRVAARTSVFRYKGNSSDIRRIGRELQVRSVVEGSVRREGPALRVTARLTNTSDGYQVWSATYDRRLEGLLAVEEELAHTIAASLRAQHLEQGTAAGSAPNPDAYRHYLAGVYWREVPTLEHLRKAAGEFSAAIAADPTYAAAQAALGEAYGRLYFTENVSPEESIVPARAAVSRALELDAQFAPAHEAAALIHMIDWDFAGAEREYRRSLRLDPSQVRVHHGYAQLVLNPAGRYQEGVDQLRQAMELDPVSINLITELGVTYRHLGNFGSARELLDKSLNLNRGALGTRTELVLLDVIPGRYAEAVRSMEAINADGQGDPWIMGHMGYIYARAGRSADARRILAALKATSTADMHIAAVHAGLGEANSALDWLERGVATRSPSMLWVKSDFRFAGLHSNPRYAALAAHLP